MRLSVAWLDDIVRNTRPNVRIDRDRHLGLSELRRIAAHPPRRATASLLHLAHCPACRMNLPAGQSRGLPARRSRELPARRGPRIPVAARGRE